MEKNINFYHGVESRKLGKALFFLKKIEKKNYLYHGVRK
jgi:hypothetical protein